MSVVNIVMLVALLLVCGSSAAKGRWPERVVCGALLLNAAFSFVPTLLRALRGEAFVAMSPNVALSADIVLLAVLGVVAVRARAAWTLFAAAFQLLATLTSVVNYASGGLNHLAYVTLQNMLWWMTLCAAAYGTWRSWTAKRARTDSSRELSPTG